MPSQKILIPVATEDDDGAELGARAAIVALRLAEPDDELLLLSVLPPALRGAGCHDDESVQRNSSGVLAAAHQLDEIAASLTGRGRAVTTHVSRASSAAEEIIRASAEAAFVVMPSHSRRGLGRLVYGSVAQQVAHEAEIPVHIICGADRQRP